MVLLGLFEELFEAARRHVLCDEDDLQGGRARGSANGCPARWWPHPAPGLPVAHPRTGLGGIQPVLMQLDNVRVVHQGQLLKHGLDLLLVGRKGLPVGEVQLIPHHLHPLLRVHGQEGALDPWHVPLVHLLPPLLPTAARALLQDVALVLALVLPLPLPAPPRRRLRGRHGSAGPGRRPPRDPPPRAAAPRPPWPGAQMPSWERQPPPGSPAPLRELGGAGARTAQGWSPPGPPEPPSSAGV